jgi:hypothetical protein
MSCPDRRPAVAHDEGLTLASDCYAVSRITTRRLLKPGLLALSLSLLAAGLPALENPPDVDLDSAEIVSLESELPIELDPMTVTTERMSVRQEAGLRLVRQAMNRPRSSRRQDIDELICWLESPVGSRLEYLYCARNGDLWAREPNTFLELDSGYLRQVPGYGRLMRADQPITRAKLHSLLAPLRGSDELDNEFVAMALAGQDPPQDIPDSEELDRFARAYYTVERLNTEGASEDEQVAAIAAESLSLKRYNRLIELVQVYQSLKNETAIRLKEISR